MNDAIDGSSSPRLLGVVLCGGQSLRMGRDKADLRLPSGTTFLGHAITRLRPFVHSISVSISGHRPDLLSDGKADCNVIEDQKPSCGPLSGILAALEFARQHHLDGCVITPVDTPLLTPSDIQVLIHQYQSNPTRVVCAMAPTSLYYEPLIGIYPTATIDPIRNAIANGSYGLQRLLGQVSPLSVILPSCSVTNFNTPADLDQLTADL